MDSSTHAINEGKGERLIGEDLWFNSQDVAVDGYQKSNMIKGGRTSLRSVFVLRFTGGGPIAAAHVNKGRGGLLARDKCEKIRRGFEVQEQQGRHQNRVSVQELRASRRERPAQSSATKCA